MALVLRVREGGRWEGGRGEGGKEEMKEFGERGGREGRDERVWRERSDTVKPPKRNFRIKDTFL